MCFSACQSQFQKLTLPWWTLYIMYFASIKKCPYKKALMEFMRQKNQVFLPGEVKCLMQQLLNAIAHLHDNWILHRDLKTSNLLLSHQGILKVGDFGLAREYGSPLKPYTGQFGYRIFLSVGQNYSSLPNNLVGPNKRVGRTQRYVLYTRI